MTDTNHSTSGTDHDYRCAYCDRPLGSLEEVCECGNAVGVLDQ